MCKGKHVYGVSVQVSGGKATITIENVTRKREHTFTVEGVKKLTVKKLAEIALKRLVSMPVNRLLNLNAWGKHADESFIAKWRQDYLANTEDVLCLSAKKVQAVAALKAHFLNGESPVVENPPFAEKSPATVGGITPEQVQAIVAEAVKTALAAAAK